MSKEKPSLPENNLEPPVDATNPAKPSGGAEVTRLKTIWNSIFARFSKRQILLAMSIAAISDLLCAFLVFAPPVVWAIDLTTALLLFAVLGWHWILDLAKTMTRGLPCRAETGQQRGVASARCHAGKVGGRRR